MKKTVRTILLLEDEPVVMDLLKMIFKPRGYVIKNYQTAEAAVRCAEYVDLLVADVSPPCSGIHVAAELTAWMPALPIILTSGYPPSLWDEQQRIELSAILSEVRVLQKPFFPSALLSMVDEMFGPTREVPTVAA